MESLDKRQIVHCKTIQKYYNPSIIYQEKSFVHKKIILNCLANAYQNYNYIIEIQYIRLYDLSLIKRRITKDIYV